MIIRKPKKLKVYKLNHIFTPESFIKKKNNLSILSITSNNEFQKKLKLKNNYDKNITEINETNKYNYKDLLLSKSNSKLSLKNMINNSDRKIYISNKKLLKVGENFNNKENNKVNNLFIKSSINNFPSMTKSYVSIYNSSYNDKRKKFFKKFNKNKFNLNNNFYMNNYKLLPKINGSKSKKYSLTLYEKEKKKQKDIYDEKLKEKILELEACEKKFDEEIFRTLSKLELEEKNLVEI